jgi:hypothetical protein
MLGLVSGSDDRLWLERLDFADIAHRDFAFELRPRSVVLPYSVTLKECQSQDDPPQ